MDIFNRIKSAFRPRATSPEILEQMIRDVFGGGIATSGVTVNPDTAMRLITVHNCIKVLSETVKQLPLHIYERDGRNRNKAEDFYLYEILHYQPNSWMTAPEFWGLAEACLALRGNFYVYIMRKSNGQVFELIPLTDGIVQKITQKPNYTIEYEIKMPMGDIKVFSNKEILHLRGLMLNGYIGLSPVEYARETMGLGLSSEKFLAKYYAKGLFTSAVIKHPLRLGLKAHTDLREELKKKYAGLSASETFSLMLIDAGMDIVFPQIKLIDAQFLEQGKFTEAQICGLFRVPLMLIQSGDKSPTYASAEQFMLSFVVHSLMPILVNIESVIRRDLMTPEEKIKYYAKFSVDGLLRGDFKTRMEGFAIGIDKEIYNPNECREWLELNPYDGGDEYRTRTSSMKQISGGE